MIVGIIGDTHIPYEHPDYLDFCRDTFRKHKVDRVIHIGDLVDNHSISYHEHDPNLLSPIDEYTLALAKLQDWYRAFPKCTLLMGNHDLLPYRKAKSSGLPKTFIKPFEEMYELPEGWDYRDSVEIEGTLYTHGTEFGGMYAHKRAMESNMQSTVIGHLHSNAGVIWTANKNKRAFGLAVGCGIDHKSPAYNYGERYPRKPIIGCGIVINGDEYAKFVPMKM